MTPWEGCARPPRRWQALALPLIREAPTREMPPAVAIGEVMRWARGLVLAFQAAGYLRAQAVQGWGWRVQPPSDRQLSRLVRMAWILRYLPDPHRSVAERAMAVPDRLCRGGVSDLIAVRPPPPGLPTLPRVWLTLDVAVPSEAALRAI